jgi:Sec-independent protein secretion pathway component TatC
MFYIREIYYRFLFITLIAVSLFSIHYQYKQTLLLIFLIPNQFLNHILIDHFIYTHPTELLMALLNLNIFFGALLLGPYAGWVVLDFLRPGLFLNEYQRAFRLGAFFFIFLLTLNLSLFSVVFPLVFKFFQSFNSFELHDIVIKFELKIFEFMDFIYSVFWIINAGLLFICGILLIIKMKGIAFYLRYKKFFFLYNIITATFLSTPDMSSQLFLFILLNMLLEIFQLLMFFATKINKATY